MRRILYLCFLFFLTLLYSSYLYSQKIENVQFKQEETKIIITYDLIGDDASKNFEVSIEMSKDGGISFSTTPKSLAGDIGSSVQPGKTKKITWDVLKDVAELRGNNFVFKVLAASDTQPAPTVKTESGGGIPTWVWIGGGAVLVGGAAAILLSSKSSESTTPTQPDLPDYSKIPWPPR